MAMGVAGRTMTPRRGGRSLTISFGSRKSYCHGSLCCTILKAIANSPVVSVALRKAINAAPNSVLCVWQEALRVAVAICSGLHSSINPRRKAVALAAKILSSSTFCPSNWSLSSPSQSMGKCFSFSPWTETILSQPGSHCVSTDKRF